MNVLKIYGGLAAFMFAALVNWLVSYPVALVAAASVLSAAYLLEEQLKEAPYES